MVDELRQTCRQLLADDKVQVVIGYGQSAPDMPVHPVFITRPEDVEQLVWNEQCMANLATYLTRKEIKALGKPAVVVKGCEEKTLVVLAQESQIEREDVLAIGMACDGVGQPRPAKCTACTVHQPRFADVTIGQADTDDAGDEHYAELDAFMQKTPAERMAYWMEEFSRCVKCYACRQACPLCYCEQCIVDKNRPTVIDTSASLKGNFAWHITRAFHQAGRCIGCDECTRACPAGINLRLLNLSLARAAAEQFGYEAGMDPQAEPIIGAYSLQDKETFIR